MATGFDPEAEQEVDFARYGRMLARRWWLVAVGVVAGAVIGFLISLGGAKVYSATATIFVGQPYNQPGTTPVLPIGANPSAAGQIANSHSVDAKVATQCNTNVEKFRKGISVQKIAAASTASKGTAQINPLVTVTVQAAKGKVATCAANGLARAIVASLGTYPEGKLRNYEARIKVDNTAIKEINAALASPSISETNALLLQQRLTAIQQDLFTTSGLLLQVQQVELPSIASDASASQVTAQSSHNTVEIAALIGLILGILAALLWDRVVPRLAARNGS